jgi:hypothetical protein
MYNLAKKVSTNIYNKKTFKHLELRRFFPKISWRKLSLCSKVVQPRRFNNSSEIAGSKDKASQAIIYIPIRGRTLHSKTAPHFFSIFSLFLTGMKHINYRKISKLQ